MRRPFIALALAAPIALALGACGASSAPAHASAESPRAPLQQDPQPLREPNRLTESANPAPARIGPPLGRGAGSRRIEAAPSLEGFAAPRLAEMDMPSARGDRSLDRE
jgi:hypothetical protein